MKETVKWSKLILPCALLIFLAGAAIIRGILYEDIRPAVHQPEANQSYFKPERPSEGSLEELYQDVFMTMLLPYIQEAVRNYYEENTAYSPNVAPYEPEILSIERPEGYRTFQFVIKLEVAPYLGAHNPIGVDHITVRVSPGEVNVEKFEHIKSYPVPPWLQ